jgi:hypothetical protein
MGRPVNKRYFSETFDAAAYVDGGSSAVAATINSQKGTKTFNVTTAQGTSDVTLVTTAPAEGEMRITATDSAGDTYYVVKLFNQTAVLVQNDGTQFDDNAKVDWTAYDSVNGGYSAISAGNEVENVSVSLVS